MYSEKIFPFVVSNENYDVFSYSTFYNYNFSLKVLLSPFHFLPSFTLEDKHPESISCKEVDFRRVRHKTVGELCLKPT